MSPSTDTTPETHPPLAPLRFRLRTLWLVVTLVCVALGLMGWVGPLGSLMLLMLLGLIACHVVGNSLGTRLRDQVSDHLREHPAAGRTRPSPADIPRAPATRLGRKTRVVGWPLLVVSTAGGVTAAVSGGREFAAAAWREIPLREWLLACGSFAVLGGFLAFMAASFLGVLLQALVEAHVYRGPVVSPSKKPAGLIDEAAVVAGPSNRGRP